MDSLKTDSALRALETSTTPPVAVNADTTIKEVLPVVYEGDIIMQISEKPEHIAFGKACNSKYNHVGIIFIRPRDRMYVVMEVNDSIGATPLKEWAGRGQGKHVAVLRLKNSKQILNDKKTEKLKKGAKDFRGKREDLYFSWSDDAFYSTELAWKMYDKALNIKICELGKLGDMDFTDASIGSRMKEKYGANIPRTENFISPDAIYKSPKMTVIYER